MALDNNYETARFYRNIIYVRVTGITRFAVSYI